MYNSLASRSASLFRSFLATLTLGILSMGAAQAIPSLSVQAQCSLLQFDNDIQRCSSDNLRSTDDGTYVAGETIGPRLGLNQFLFPDFSNGSFSYVESLAKANYGSVGVSAMANVYNGPSALVNDLTRQAVAASAASWYDSFTLQSQTLTIGTPVTVRVTELINVGQIFSGGLGAIAQPIGPQETGGRLLFQSSLAPTGYCIATGWYSTLQLCQGYAALALGTNSFAYDVVLQVGQTLSMAATLGAVAVVELFSGQIAVGGATVEAINTAHTYFDVIGADASIAWASGTDYRTPPVVGSVPEPETYTLMLAGLGFMGLVARRRKAKTTAPAVL